MRNKEKDAAKIAQRKQRAMEYGFRLFSERGIESVTMPEIADASGVGRPSLYRYFSSKVDLVIAIGTWKWKDYIDQRDTSLPFEDQEHMTAAEYLKWYLDSFIDLYLNHSDILRFNYYFNSFLQHEAATPEQQLPYVNIIEGLSTSFHKLYQRGLIDKTIRTDISEEIMFSSTFHIMLAAVIRYAVGLVYPGIDYYSELLLLENALLHEFTRRPAHAE